MDMMGRVLSVRAETSLTRSLEMTTGVRMPGSGECRAAMRWWEGRVKVEEGRLSDEVARTEDRNCSVSVFHTKQRIHISAECR